MPTPIISATFTLCIININLKYNKPIYIGELLLKTRKLIWLPQKQLSVSVCVCSFSCRYNGIAILARKF